MTADLTFVPGRVPGIARSRIATKGPGAAALRRPPAHAAAPVTQPRDPLLPGMTAPQRQALAALIHTPAGGDDGRDGVLHGATNVAWMAVVACALAWTMAIVVELAPDLGFARTAPSLWVAQPHVGETHPA